MTSWSRQRGTAPSAKLSTSIYLHLMDWTERRDVPKERCWEDLVKTLGERTLHSHLWRIEISAYPNRTQQGSHSILQTFSTLCENRQPRQFILKVTEFGLKSHAPHQFDEQSPWAVHIGRMGFVLKLWLHSAQSILFLTTLILSIGLAGLDKIAMLWFSACRSFPRLDELVAYARSTVHYPSGRVASKIDIPLCLPTFCRLQICSFMTQ